MLEHRLPRTRAEASKVRYNQWAGNPNGTPWDPTRCAFEVYEGGRGGMFYQCLKKPGKGPGGLYCGMHNPEALDRAKARQEARDRRCVEELDTQMALSVAREELVETAKRWLGASGFDRTREEERLARAVRKLVKAEKARKAYLERTMT